MIMARVNQHPCWYLQLVDWGLFVAILSSKNDEFDLRDPDLGRLYTGSKVQGPMN
jgi:hypothetical protein